MRSLMLALGACLFALNFAGCNSTGGCNGGCHGGGLLGGGILAGRSGGCSGGCGESACSGGCGDMGCSGGCGQNSILNNNFGGQSGLGLGLMEAGPSCQAAGCNGGCQSCLGAMRPKLGSRLAGGGCGIGGILKRGCGATAPAPTLAGSDCGCGASAESDCGCGASAPVELSLGDTAGGGIQLVSHEDRGGLLGKLFRRGHHQVRGAHGCGIGGCGGPGGLCSSCRARLAGALGVGQDSIPHRDPTIHGGGAAGPAGQIPTYAYPYYTTRAPRDFLDPNPPTIGY